MLMFDFRAPGRSEGGRVSLEYFERQDLLGVLGFSMGGGVGIITAL